MPYSNIAWTAFDGIKTVLEASISNLNVVNVYRFPEDDDTQQYTGRHRRAALVKLDTDAFHDQASDCREYEYTFMIRVLVIDTDEDQKDLMDLCEEIKFTLYGTQNNSTTWYNLIVDPIQYLDEDTETNIKKAEFALHVFTRG